MIFSIIQVLRGEAVTSAASEAQGLATFYESLSLLNPLFLLGLITGGAIIYWFTGASIKPSRPALTAQSSSSKRTSGWKALRKHPWPTARG